MASNGSLDEAALLIEASIQRGELGEGGYEAWLLLGRARSMDEREAQALRALREGTRIAELNGSPGVGLLVSSIAHHQICCSSSLSILRISLSVTPMNLMISQPIIRCANGLVRNTRQWIHLNQLRVTKHPGHRTN
jgi:hypothetical protein